MPLIQDLPLLTVYRSGLVNLNGEASRLLSRSASLLLLSPTRTEPRWLLLPAATGITGEFALHGRADRGNLRFRAQALAISLFAALPSQQRALQLSCEALAGNGWRLIPWCATSAQQKITS